MKRHLFTVLKFGISIAILWYLFSRKGQTEQFQNLLSGEKNWTWLTVGLLGCLAAHVIGFVRWQIIVKSLGLSFRLVDAVRIGFIGLFFNLVAFGVIGGDALRAFYVSREFPDHKTESISTVIADRVIGLLTMLVIASVAFLMFDASVMEASDPDKLKTISIACKMVVTLTSIGVAGLAVLCLAPNLAETKLFKKLLDLPKIGGIIKSVLDAIRVFRSKPMAIFLSFLLSFFVNVCFAVSIYGLAMGLVPTVPEFQNHLLIEPITMVCNAAPVPGGIGTMEAALDFLYNAFGSQNGLVVAFAFRFCILTVSAIGAFVWFLNRSNVKELMDSESE